MDVKKLLIMAAVCLGMAACDDNNNEAQKSEPGYFKVSQIQSPASDGRQKESVQTGPAAIFDLGNIKASKDFYFLLENGGDGPIFDIELSVDNAAVSVSPKKITTLNSSQTGNVIPLVSVGFTHGTQLNGIGFTNVLPMGSNSTTLSITGKTLVNGDTVSLQTDIALTVFAELLDVQLFEDQTEIDMTKPESFPGISPDQRTYVASSTPLRMKNTGNVDVAVHFDRHTRVHGPNPNQDYADESAGDFVLTPGQTETLPLNSYDIEHYADWYQFTIEGNGAIADPNRNFIPLSGKISIIVNNH